MLLSHHLPTVIRVLIRWIKSKLCDGVRRHAGVYEWVCVMASTEDHKVCRGAPWLDGTKSCILFQGYSTLRLVCFGFFLSLFFNVKTDELPVTLNYRPNVTLPSSGRERHCRSCDAGRESTTSCCDFPCQTEQTEWQDMIIKFTCPYLPKWWAVIRPFVCWTWY